MFVEEEEEFIDIKEEIYKDISSTNPATKSRQGTQNPQNYCFCNSISIIT